MKGEASALILAGMKGAILRIAMVLPPGQRNGLTHLISPFAWGIADMGMILISSRLWIALIIVVVSLCRLEPIDLVEFNLASSIRANGDKTLGGAFLAVPLDQTDCFDNLEDILSCVGASAGQDDFAFHTRFDFGDDAFPDLGLGDKFMPAFVTSGDICRSFPFIGILEKRDLSLLFKEVLGDGFGKDSLDLFDGHVCAGVVDAVNPVCPDIAATATAVEGDFLSADFDLRVGVGLFWEEGDFVTGHCDEDVDACFGCPRLAAVRLVVLVFVDAVLAVQDCGVLD